MSSQKIVLLVINVLGGIGVLGSYAYCFATYPDGMGEFWGGVPESWWPLYTTNMFLAAAGYFAFTFFVAFRLDPEARFGLGTFNLCYAAILFPSALWMPLTFEMLEAPSDALWWAIRAVLAIVGCGSLGLLAGLFAVRPPAGSMAHRLAVAGCASFALQTAVLDAIVWPAYFFA